MLPLSKTHHAAFDRELFTIDQDYRLQVNPEFNTESEILRTTIIDNDGAPVPFRNQRPDVEYLSRHNETLDWLTT